MVAIRAVHDTIHFLRDVLAQVPRGSAEMVAATLRPLIKLSSWTEIQSLLVHRDVAAAELQ
jgi:hypothetical protein